MLVDGAPFVSCLVDNGMVFLPTLILWLAFATIYVHAQAVRIPLYRSSMRATLLKGTNQDNYPSADGLHLAAETFRFVPLVEEVFIVKATFGEPRKSKAPLTISPVLCEVSKRLSGITITYKSEILARFCSS